MANPLPTFALPNIGSQRSAFRNTETIAAPHHVSGIHAIEQEGPINTAPLRRHVRIASHIRAVLHCKYRFQSIVIRNISRGGAGLDNCGHLIENDKVVISLLNGRRIEARVRWWLAGVCGVQFNQLLEPTDILLKGRSGYTIVAKNALTCINDPK